MKDFVYITTNWKILKRMGIPDHLTCLLRNLYAGQEATVRTRHSKWTGSKSEKEYAKTVYSHLAHLTYMQSTSCKMPDWITHKLESRLQGEISITSDMQKAHGRKQRGTKEPLDESERGEWKSWLKTEHSKKTKIMVSDPINSWQIDGKQWKQWQTLLSWASKSLQTVTAAMKLKDTCSLEEKLWPT